MIGGTAILLLAGVFLCGGFLEAIHPVAATARQGGWLGGEGYYYRGGSVSGDAGQGLLTGAEWERMARFARARSEMEGGNLRTAESLWTELIAEGGDPADAYNNRGIVRVRLGKTEEGLADFEAAASLEPGRRSGPMERLPGVPAGVPAGAGRPDPAGRLGRNPRPRPLRLPRRGDDPRRTGRRAAAGRRRVEEPVHRAGRVVSGGPEERVPRPVLPPRSRGMGHGVSGGRVGLGGAVETSLPENLDEQRLPFVRRRHAGRQEPRSRRHLQRVPRAGRQGDPRSGRSANCGG